MGKPAYNDLTAALILRNIRPAKKMAAKLHQLSGGNRMRQSRRGACLTICRRRGSVRTLVRGSAMRLVRKSAQVAIFAGCLLGAMLGAAARAQTPAMPGQTLAFDRSKGNCLTCHDIKGGDAPGNVGPALADMKKRFPDRKALAAIIFDETKRNPQTAMPPFGRNLILTNEDIEAVVDFLYTR
jgi:sulfur-oxidizing protein SoxX